jgi:hypothetical protein
MLQNKTIQNIQKQNDSIFASLVAKNIQFERIICSEGITEEEHIILLNIENTKLKETIKVYKPPPQLKEEKPKQELNKKQEVKPKEKDIEKDIEEDEDNEILDEPIKKFDIITNMEDMKRAFFNKDYKIFEEQLKNNSFKLFKVNYKYNSDKDGSPDFSAKNLLKGFVRNFDDYRKYFMICFRCWKHQQENIYRYDSFWIVNTNEPIQNIIGSLYDDFDFIETIDNDDFIVQIKKIPEIDEPIYTNNYFCIGESYVH